VEDSLDPAVLRCGPTTLTCSAMAVDQILTVEQFYCSVRGSIGASHSPLLSEDFLVEHCAALRKVFTSGGPRGQELLAALRAQYLGDADRGGSSDVFATLRSTALASVYSRLHGLPGYIKGVGPLPATAAAGSGSTAPGRALRMLPRLRRQLPCASAQGLEAIFTALSGAGS
jgi:hypothetical protein